MTIDQQNILRRQVEVLCADVICQLSDGSVYLLKEDRQEFKDGRVKRRNLDSSIGEKIKPSEASEDAVARALKEELGIGRHDSMFGVGYSERTFMPDTFPGIESSYKMHQYVTVIPEDEFNPEGYIEYQTDKTNFYTWELIHTPSNKE